MTTSVDTSYGSWPATTPPFITKYGVVTNPSTSFSTGVILDPYGAPPSLFINNEQGVWYDPSDFSTMFQDSAGTTPVTAVEQPVGLVLDKSKGLVLGPELVVNGDFSNGTTGWTPSGNNLSVVNDELLITVVGGTNTQALQSTPAVIGKSYLVTATARRGTTTGNVAVDFGGVRVLNTALTTNTTVQSVVTATTTAPISLVFYSLTYGTTAYFDNISVRELPGQHSKQATAAARPVLRATPTRIDYDAVDDTLVATFASSLGTDCTVCRAVPSVGASILTAQTIGTTYTDNTDHCGLIIVNRALTAGETSSVTAYLNSKAGV